MSDDEAQAHHDANQDRISEASAEDFRLALTELSGDSALAVLRNLFETARLNPHEQTSRSYFRSVNAHYDHERSTRDAS